jgi:phosphatidylinositol alpha-mannosyltransferase
LGLKSGWKNRKSIVMKIALVTPYDYPYPGGVTEHIRHLDREFRARGHMTRIIAPSSESQDALPANVIKVSNEVLPVPVNGSIARLTLSPEILHRIEAILDAKQFDIIHLHEPEVPLLGWAVLHRSRAINVATFHAYSENPRLKEYAQPLLEWVHTRLHGRIFVSNIVRDSITQHLPGDYRVIPNGIDYARFASSTIQPIEEFDDGRPNILFVGRLDARKGFQNLLQAYEYIKRDIAAARLLIVGAFREEDKAPFTEFISAHHLCDVHLIGRVSPEDLARYYRTATLFCAPSTGGESFGIVLLEAMAAGLPIVASDIAGYRSVMQDGVQGKFVHAGDTQSIAQAIITLLRNPHVCAKMSERGKATAMHLDWKVVAPRVLAYYEELIQARAWQRTKRRNVPLSVGASSSRKVSGTSIALDLLMTGLGVFEKEWAANLAKVQQA